MHYLSSCLLLFSLVFAFGCKPNPNPQKPLATGDTIALFDGRSFKGWEGNLDFFRIEADAIVGGSLDEAIPQNQFLCTEGSFGDFELRLKVKFWPKNNNGGIQIRSERIADHHEVIGYQVDVGYAGQEAVWASIYDESRRNRFVARAPIEAVDRLLREADYNDYRIRCEGKRIQVWFNGEQLIDYTETEPDIVQRGVICVQIHGGPPSEAWYKDMILEQL